MPLVRRRYFFSGHVQGVGFRATCRHLAGGYQVLGHVRNLSDGRVELLAEGSSAEIDRLIEAIKSEMGHYIRETTVHDEPCGEPALTSFAIRL
ncbi:Acylphosphatase [Aquisphaera giovannonii]|uniref:acylphosphatase n=1 Tax=Aquisphaera giovannonii TaxID=406548 RepID=A0A5B9W918_9BACT|nr:acylphosphatase [Aquisphaera giovannonii]QEH37116.1 Acylphosphatase [Aquisphaera giovannonii]